MKRLIVCSLDFFSEEISWERLKREGVGIKRNGNGYLKLFNFAAGYFFFHGKKVPLFTTILVKPGEKFQINGREFLVKAVES